MFTFQVRKIYTILQSFETIYLCFIYRYVFSVGYLCSNMGCIYVWRLDASVTQVLPTCNAWRCALGHRYCGS